MYSRIIYGNIIWNAKGSPPILFSLYFNPLRSISLSFHLTLSFFFSPTPQSPFSTSILIPFFSLLPFNLSDTVPQALKFGPITGLPDESEFVIYGAACKYKRKIHCFISLYFFFSICTIMMKKLQFLSILQENIVVISHLSYTISPDMLSYVIS